MTTIRNFCCNDLLRISSANLDHLSVTTTVYLYMLWLAKFPNYSHVAIAPGNRMMGYLFGALKMNKEDLEEDNWHGLTIFLNIASDYRRQKLGTILMRLFESQMVERRHSTKRGSSRFPFRHYLQKSNDIGVANYYMYLYIGVFNIPALRFYSKIGYRYVAIQGDYFFKKHEFDALEMTKEISEETLSRVEQEIGVCSICDKDKSANYSYVCLPRICRTCDEASASNFDSPASNFDSPAGPAKKKLKRNSHI